MALRNMYVVLLRDKGLFVVEPEAEMTQSAAIEAALGLKGGYSAGLVEVDIPEGAEEVWAAWVEGEGPKGPYFMFRTLPADLSEQAAEAALREAGEEPLKLNRSPLYHPVHRQYRHETPPEPDAVEFQPE